MWFKNRRGWLPPYSKRPPIGGKNYFFGGDIQKNAVIKDVPGNFFSPPKRAPLFLKNPKREFFHQNSGKKVCATTPQGPKKWPQLPQRDVSQIPGAQISG